MNKEDLLSEITVGQLLREIVHRCHKEAREGNQDRAKELAEIGENISKALNMCDLKPPPKSLSELISVRSNVTIGESGGRPWFRYDYAYELDPKEAWSEMCDVQDDLRELGWEIIDPCIEHDVLSGELQRV
jgi:hypothetical protein